MQVMLQLNNVSFNLQTIGSTGVTAGVGYGLQVRTDVPNYEIINAGGSIIVENINTAKEAAEGALRELVRVGEAIKIEAERQLRAMP